MVYSRNFLTHPHRKEHPPNSKCVLQDITFLCHVIVEFQHIWTEDTKQPNKNCKLQVDIHLSDVYVVFHCIQSTVKLCYKNIHVTEQSLYLCKTQYNTCTYNKVITTKKLKFLNFAVDFTLFVHTCHVCVVWACMHWDVLLAASMCTDSALPCWKSQITHSVIKLFLVSSPLALIYVIYLSVVQVPTYLWLCFIHFKGQGENREWHPYV